MARVSESREGSASFSEEVGLVSSGAGNRSRCLEGHGPLEAPGDCRVGDGQQGPSSGQQTAPLTSRATMGASVHCPFCVPKLSRGV